MKEIDRLLTIVDAPAIVKPHLHFFYNKDEVKLIMKLERKKLTADEIAERIEIPVREATELLEKAYRRFVVDREAVEERILYCTGAFVDRLEYCAIFENYYLLPRKLRRNLGEWSYQQYLERHDYFKTVLNGEPAYDGCHNDVVLLLEELEEMIEAAPTIRMMPCDCKMLTDSCDYSREVCFWFSPEEIEERTRGADLGRVVTKVEALQLARALNREGLIHTGGPHDWREKGPGVVCSCCTCCCYPFRAAREMGTKGKWPHSRYIASYDPTLCSHCGRCIRRCQFEAFTFGDKLVEVGDKERKEIVYDPELCWGCGLCAQTCPEKAITMEPLSDGIK